MTTCCETTAPPVAVPAGYHGGMAPQLPLFGPEPPEDGGGRDVSAVDPLPEHVRWAEALPALVRLGTSSWSFPGWAGIVYRRRFGQTALARHGLAAYSQHPLLKAVGVDRTYYAPVGAEVFAAYAASVPDGFRFLVKASEDCVLPTFPDHARHGERRGRENPLFLDARHAAEVVVAPFLEGLGEKAGPLLFQFPPLPVAALGGAARFAGRLHAFLEALPEGPRYAVEIRNRELLTKVYGQALAAVGACHCYSVHTSLPGLTRQAEILPLAEQPALVVRWMLGAGLEYEQAVERYEPFDRIVDEDPVSRSRIHDLCREAVRLGKEALVIVNNKAEGSSPLSVFRLAAELARR